MTFANRRGITRLKAVTTIIIVAVAAVAGYYAYLQSLPPSLQNVRIARQAPDTPTLMVMTVAQKSGFFAKNGINATVIEVPAPPLVMQSLVSGQADIGDLSVLGGFAGLTQGSPVKIVAITNVVWNFIIVAKANFTSLKDLKGATLAIVGPGVGDDVILKKAAESVGVSADDLKFVSVGISPRKFQAVITGRADATAIVNEFIPRVQARNDLKILEMNAGRFFPMPFHLILARTDFIEKNPQVVNGVVKTLIEVMRKFQTDQQFFVDQVTKYYGNDYTPGDAKLFFDNLRAIGYWGVNGGINLAKLDNAIQLYYNEINPSAPRNFVKKGSDMVNTQFLTSALSDLGVVDASWDVPDWRTR